MDETGKWKLGTLAGEGHRVMETMVDGQTLIGPTARCHAGKDGAKGCQSLGFFKRR